MRGDGMPLLPDHSGKGADNAIHRNHPENKIENLPLDDEKQQLVCFADIIAACIVNQKENQDEEAS